jgi:hypothetical protein
MTKYGIVRSDENKVVLCYLDVAYESIQQRFIENKGSVQKQMAYLQTLYPNEKYTLLEMKE